MGERIKVESYQYWLRACLTAAIPQPREWRDVWSDAVDLMQSLAYAIGMTLLRLLILLTSPISVPILAAFALHANRRVVEARERLHAETLNSLRSLQQKDPS